MAARPVATWAVAWVATKAEDEAVALVVGLAGVRVVALVVDSGVERAEDSGVERAVMMGVGAAVA